MKTTKKKTILMTLITVSALGLMNICWAQKPTAAPAPNPFANQMAEFSAEMKNIMNQQFSSIQTELKQLFKKGFQLIHQQNYQTDPSLTTIMAANTANQTLNNQLNASVPYTYSDVGPGQLASAYAQLLTQIDIDNSLKQFIYATRPYSNLSATMIKLQAPSLDASYYDPTTGRVEKISFHQYMQENSMAVLSGIQPNANNQITTTNNITAGFGNSETGTELPTYAADDTLFVGDTAKNALASDVNKSLYVQKPTQVNNNLFNFSAMFTPIAYTPAQFQIASNYLKFATQDSSSLYSQKIFSPLTTGRLSQPEHAKQRALALYYLKQNPVYQNFKLYVRNYLALRSISSSFLNEMIAERTPITGLGTSAGLMDSKGNPIPNASPLQVQSYVATHRVESPSWYNDVENASPATIQRKTLIVLAEIERQNYQAHLDRERLLAAITALNVNMQRQSMQTYLQTTSQDLNSAVTSAISRAFGNKATNNTDSQTNNSAQFTTDANENSQYDQGQGKQPTKQQIEEMEKKAKEQNQKR